MPGQAGWRFEEDRQKRRSWHRIARDGSIEVSCARPMKTYGAAVHDAITHGFQPSIHAWDTRSRVAKFHNEPMQGRGSSSKAP